MIKSKIVICVILCCFFLPACPASNSGLTADLEALSAAKEIELEIVMMSRLTMTVTGLDDKAFDKLMRFAGPDVTLQVRSKGMAKRVLRSMMEEHWSSTELKISVRCRLTFRAGSTVVILYMDPKGNIIHNGCALSAGSGWIRRFKDVLTNEILVW